MNSGIFTKISSYVILSVMALSMLTPFLWMLGTSLMGELEVYQYPPKFIPEKILWNNYREALTLLPFGRFFLNTIIISTGAVLGQLVLCSMAAFAFSRLSFRGRDLIFAIYLATMMIPGIVTMIPTYLIINSFGWINSYWAMITPAMNSVWGIFLLSLIHI